jgi:N-acetyl-anhydromuramyl-L-alanine amidase AmpD
MLTIDSDGMLAGDKRIQAQRYPAIEHGSLAQVRAFVVHQTDSSTDQSAFHSYGKGLDGAHFLIGKAGTIYQTASVNSVCYHVGRYIKSKCLEVNKSACSDQAAVKLLAL